MLNTALKIYSFLNSIYYLSNLYTSFISSNGIRIWLGKSVVVVSAKDVKGMLVVVALLPVKDVLLPGPLSVNEGRLPGPLADGRLPDPLAEGLLLNPPRPRPNEKYILIIFLASFQNFLLIFRKLK